MSGLNGDPSGAAGAASSPAPSPILTGHLLLPLHHELMALLRGLTPADWARGTDAPGWSVRRVAAHLVDTKLRRISLQRDGHVPPPPPIDSGPALLDFLNRLNADWIVATDRLSPEVLMAMLERFGPEMAEFLAGLPPDGEAHWPVAWAGESASRHWMDVGREYTSGGPRRRMRHLPRTGRSNTVRRQRLGGGSGLVWLRRAAAGGTFRTRPRPLLRPRHCPCRIADSESEPGSGPLRCSCRRQVPVNPSRQLPHPGTSLSARARDNQLVIMSPAAHCLSEAAGVPTKVGDREFGDARLPYLQIYLDWFDHWLKGIDNGVTQRPRVQYYVTGLNEWRTAPNWPVPAVKPTRYFLGDGRLSPRVPAPGRDVFRYDPDDPVPSRGGTVCCTGNPKDQPGAFDQSDLEGRKDLLIYSTPPLERGVTVAGTVTTALYVSSDRKDTDSRPSCSMSTPKGGPGMWRAA